MVRIIDANIMQDALSLEPSNDFAVFTELTVRQIAKCVLFLDISVARRVLRKRH